MDWESVIGTLGGGPLAVAVVGLSFVVWKLLKRQDELTDKFIALAQSQTETLNSISRKVEAERQVTK